jgi:hypothetical protein
VPTGWANEKLPFVCELTGGVSAVLLRYTSTCSALHVLASILNAHPCSQHATGGTCMSCSPSHIDTLLFARSSSTARLLGLLSDASTAAALPCLAAWQCLPHLRQQMCLSRVQIFTGTTTRLHSQFVWRFTAVSTRVPALAMSCNCRQRFVPKTTGRSQ